MRYAGILSRPLSLSVLTPADAGDSFGISDPRPHLQKKGQLENKGSTVLTFMLIIFIVMLINHHSY